MSIPVELKSLLESDPEILGGTICFAGTRIPVRILFDHVNQGVSLDEFLEGYPSVPRDAALQVMAWQEMATLKVLEAA